MTNEMNDADLIFSGSVVDQFLAETEYGDLQLILTIDVTSRLRDPRDRGAGTEDVPREQHETRLTFSETERGEKATQISIKNLGRFGFTGTDFSRLHPDHEDFYSLIGRDVHIRPREKDGVTYWNLAWPRSRPRPAPLDDVVERMPGLRRRVEQIQANADVTSASHRATPPARQSEVGDDA
jgi:hypothetical protein